jgi:hypothetical protein
MLREVRATHSDASLRMTSQLLLSIISAALSVDVSEQFHPALGQREADD